MAEHAVVIVGGGPTGLMLAGAFALIFAAPDLDSRWLEAGWVLVFFVLAASAYAGSRLSAIRSTSSDIDARKSRSTAKKRGKPASRCM